MRTGYGALGGDRQGGQAPKPKGLTPYPAVRGVGQPPGSEASAAVELEGASTASAGGPHLGPHVGAPDVRKNAAGGKKPPLRTGGKGLLLSVALGQNSRGLVSEETKGVCKV